MIRKKDSERFRPRRTGVAATEMAILLPFLALILSATLDFARVFHTCQVLETAAGNGAAYASGSAWVPVSTGTASDAARNAAVSEGAALNPPLRPDQVDVSTSGGSTTVTVSYDFPLLTAVFIPEGSVHLQRTAVSRIVPKIGE